MALDDPSMTITTVAQLPVIENAAIIPSTGYTVWYLAVKYKGDQGLRGMVPCGDAGLPAQIVRKQTSSACKTIMWRVESYGGGQPLAPSWDTGSANEVLFDWEIEGIAPFFSVDSKKGWFIQGVYQYYLQVPPILGTDALTIGLTPVDPTNINVNVLTPAQFLTKFVGPSASPQGFSGGKGKEINF